MPNKIDALYSEVSKSYEVGSIDDFKKYLADPKKRQLFFKEVIAPEYDVKSIDDFDEAYGFKKKSTESPGQGAQKDIFSVSGETPKAGPSVSSVNPPSNKLQEELFQKTRLAASAVTASAKPGYTPVPQEEAQKSLYGKAKVTPMALDLNHGTKENIVSDLNKDFGKLGVRFEQPQNPLAKSMGDVVATADNGESITIQASDNERLAKSESEKLQNFLMNNSAGAEKKEVTPIDMLRMTQGGISEIEENKFKRVYTPEMINETVKFVNDEVTKSNKKLQDINSQIQQVNNEAARLNGIVGTATPEEQGRIKELTDRYDLLKADFDKERENAKVISKLGSEGVNMAAAEHLRLLEQKGGFGKSIYNHTVNMVGDTVNGVFQLASLGIMDKGAAYGQDLTSQFKEEFKYAGTEVYEENSNMAMKVLFSMPEWLPMAAMGPAAGTAFMFNQGVGRRMEEVNSNEETKNLSQAEKLAMVAPMAYVEARLENLGLSAWLSKNKGLASSIAIKAVANVAPKAGAAGVARLINTEINNLALKGVFNVAGATLAEAETGALQYATESGMKELYNIAEGKQIFKQPQFGSEAWAKELAESSLMEGLGGMFVSGPINIAQQTANYVVGKSNTNQTFGIVKDLLNDNIAERSMIAQLNAAVNDGKLSKEKAQNILYNFREAKAIVRELPQELSEDNQRAAFDLIAEKRKLTKQIEGKDPSLVNKQKKRITEIENQLIDISNAVQEQSTSEVPVQSGAQGGQEVVEGKPQPEPKVAAEEGQAKEEVAKQYVADLQATKQSNPEQYWSVDSVTEEAAKEGTVITDEDGGVVVSKDGDIKGLFKKAASKAKGVAQKLLQKAVEAGGIKLDNFDNYLTPVYEKAGFRVVSRVPFNEQYAPEGWNKEKHGTPDVVAMVYDPQNKLDIQEQKFEDYDEAMAYRDQLVEQAKTEYPIQSNFDEAVNKSAQALNVVAPGLKVIVGENIDDVQNRIVEAIAPLVGERQALQTAEEFATGTKGQTIFVDGKPFAVVFDKATADSRTAGHEAWEVMLNDAFGNDQAKFKDFTAGIDSQLRAQGFDDIADKLDAFASQKGYEAVKYSEYMAELGGMLVESGFGKGPLTAQQKTLLQKIGDIINKFAELFTGKKQFLDQATPEDILGFMVTISEKVSKGEDVSSFFRPAENTETIKDTKKVLSNRSQKIGDFDIQYFEDEAQFKDLVDRGLVVQNASIDEAAGQPVATHQPDNLLVGNVNYKGKQIMEGNGGIYYVLKFGNVWASGKQTSAKTLSNYINKSRKESTDGIGRMVLVRGSQDKMISSVQGVKAAMRILEELVFDNLISTSDFRKALTIAGKAYNIDFSGSNSAKQIQKDIEDKFMNVSDSTFARRGDFFSTLVNEIGKLDSAKKNIKKIQKALGATKNIQFSKGGIRQQIGTVLTERLLIGLDSGNAYAIVEVNEDVIVKKDDQHPSYPFSIVTKSGKPPVLKVFNYRPKAIEAITTMSGEKASNAKLGLAQMGMGMGRIASDKEIVVKSRSQKAFDENIKKEEFDVKLKYNNNGQLLAPNGKPSNLNEDLARYTRTTVFKNWFGDWEKDSKNASKVVDENGEPLVVYHGSPYGGIKTFDRKESAKVSSGLKEFGTYFTTNRKVADIYASEGKISPEKINELNRQISKLKETQDNTRNSSDYYNLEKEIEALKKNKSPKVYAAFLNLRSIKDFDAEQKSFPEAWRNLKVDAGYKTATDRDAMDFLREGKFGVKKVDGIKASDIVDIVSQGKKDNDFVGDVYLVFDSAPDAIRIAETPTVESRSQKAVPPVVDEVLTDDGKGNYLFVHYSRANRDVIKPMSGSKENFTSKEEVSAISSVGGLAMYYTKAGQKENGVGDIPHTVLVPKDKVYFYGTTEKGTVSNDPEGFEEEARQRFQAYKNRGNEDRPTKYAFDSNNAAAWVTKVAAENGYDMVITNWGSPKSYRAQTTKTLKAEDEYTGFKKPEPVVFEVGDEIFVSGSYGNVTAVNGSLVRYEGTNQYGGAVSGVFDLNRNSNAIMIEKAKPSVTTRSQKVEVKTIPGYDRMMNEVEGIMDKTMNRGGSYNQASANAINYLQKSAVYEKADDIQREQIIRDFKKVRGEKMKTAPSVAKIMGQIKDVKQVTVKESTALKDQIKLEAKAAKDSATFVKQLRMDISNQLKSMVGRGMMSARQATAIISRYDKMNILNPVMRDRFVDYMYRVFQSAEYMDKIKEASKLRASIKKAMKSPANQAEIAKLAKDFGDIDPSRVENIDDYINNATQMLNAVARKTGDPLMRSLVNAADMASYIDTEIESQREQIKNELLDKYKELVDAGVLSSDMTINEIKKIVAAIEENEGESVAKEEKAKAAVKEMMAEVSPFIVQIVKTGEDPFTGEPISLTQDEKKSLIALTKMDTDNLSLSEALQVLEYANNFVANGITSGIDGMVSLYQGGLNAGELVDDGVKSIPLSKYLSKPVGRVWGEGFATLPMLNKLLWGNTRRAIMVSERAGINGVSNGKAKALKMVDTAVKQYVKLFSKTKDFLSSENVVERGVFAFMSRNVIGDEFQAQDEFNRRKSLIEETIQALTDVDNNTDAEIKKGEVIQKVYDKVLKVAKNINDVKKNVSQINQDAVRWWINKWSENFDRIDEVSRNVYNTELSRDIDFTPDRMQLKEAPTAVEEDFDSGFFGNFEYVDTSKSGSLRKNNRIKTLPKDKNGVRKRIVNLDFDVNNVNALTSAMVDVETASSVMQMKGFVTSKNFSKLFSNKEDKNLYKKRLVKYVGRVKGGSYVDQNELAKVNRFINTVASFGVAKALFSAAQPFKQFIPPMLNTLAQTRRFDIGELFRGGMGFIDKSGYPIANRGIASQGELKSINRQLVEAEKNVGSRVLDFFANISNKSLELMLKNPDVYAARASWISFYLKGLQKQGQSTSNIDWNTHQINKEAADYAQAMVDSQQNISDTDMQGEIFASKQPATVFLRRAALPLMTFTLNQKTRIWSDIRTFSNGVSSNEDKIEAAKSLSGALIELVAFQGVALFFKELYNVVANSIMGEDEDEEEKKIRKMRQSQSTAQAFMKDFFLPPIPGMDVAASMGINYLLDESGLSDELPGAWFGIEDEEQKYRLYDKMNQGYLDMLGTQGIAAEKALELVDYYDAAIDGEFTKEYNGNKVKKALMEEDLDLARMNAVIMTAYYGGLLPSDMANIVNIMNKKIQKRAEQVEND